MSQAGNGDLHIECREDCRTLSPALNGKCVFAYLWPKTLEILDHLLCPIGSELIMSLVGHKPRLTTLKIGGRICQLVINIGRVNDRKVSESGWLPGNEGRAKS